MRYAIALLLLTSCVHGVKEAPSPTAAEEIIVTGARIERHEPEELVEAAPPPAPAPLPKVKKSSAPKMAAGVRLDNDEFMSITGIAGAGARHSRTIEVAASICPQCPACPSCPGCPACPACPAPPEPEKPKPWWHDTLKVIAGAFGGAFAMRFATFFGWKAEAS